ncbi:MAG: glycosyltransferase family 4 protein [Bacteroidota bacterium]
MASRILLLANSSWNLLHFRKPLIQAFREAGHEVFALAPADQHREALAAMCTYLPLTRLHASGQNPMQDWQFFRELERVFRQVNPDLILPFTIKPCIWAPRAARKQEIACVPTMTGLGYSFLSGTLRKQLVLTLLRRNWRGVSRVIFQNPDDRRLFLEARLVKEEKTNIVPGSGVDTEHFSVAPWPKENTPVTFVFVGRMLKDKGILELIRACKMAYDQPIECLLIGGTDADNPAALSYRDLSRRLGSSSAVYLGSQEDIRPYLARAHAMILPSYREGMPKSVLEAMSMGRPILASDVPGCRDTISSGKNGFLFPARSAEGIHRAVQIFIAEGPVRWKEMGQASRVMVEERFAAPIIQQAYLDLLKEVGL